MIPFLARLKKQHTISQLAAEYYFGPGLHVRGTIQTDNDIYLDCNFAGKLITEGLIEIDVNARAKAEVSARTLLLHGELKGPAQVRERAVLAGNASYEGDLQASVLEVQPGAQLKGQVRAEANV